MQANKQASSEALNRYVRSFEANSQRVLARMGLPELADTNVDWGKTTKQADEFA